MTIFSTKEQQRIREDLFGDQAHEAENFIDMMAGFSPGCS
ncbi:Uncharacterised protein [Legionella geestiana]|nr:Uncharacterised protein [Legionella geestiana]